MRKTCTIKGQLFKIPVCSNDSVRDTMEAPIVEVRRTMKSTNKPTLNRAISSNGASLASLSQLSSSFTTSSIDTSDPLLDTSWSSFANLSIYGSYDRSLNPNETETVAEKNNRALSQDDSGAKEWFKIQFITLLGVISLQIRLYLLSFLDFLRPDVYRLSPLLIRRRYRQPEKKTLMGSTPVKKCCSNDLAQKVDGQQNRRSCRLSEHNCSRDSVKEPNQLMVDENVDRVKVVSHKENDDANQWGFFADFDEHFEENELHFLSAKNLKSSLSPLEEEEEQDDEE